MEYAKWSNQINISDTIMNILSKINKSPNLITSIGSIKLKFYVQACMCTHSLGFAYEWKGMGQKIYSIYIDCLDSYKHRLTTQWELHTGRTWGLSLRLKNSPRFL